jgi:hypothetical protein
MNMLTSSRSASTPSSAKVPTPFPLPSLLKPPNSPPGILGLFQAFFFQWLYFEIDHAGVHVHAIRRHWVSSTAWIILHLPFVLSYALAAATLSKLVLAHDCKDANFEDLGEAFQGRIEAVLEDGLRW